jgi:hypothetical protein
MARSSAVQPDLPVFPAGRSPLATLLAGQDVEPAIANALPAAEAVAGQILAAYGAVSTDDGFFRAVSDFARAHFGLSDAETEFEQALGLIENRCPDLRAYSMEVAAYQRRWRPQRARNARGRGKSREK